MLTVLMDVLIVVHSVMNVKMQLEVYVILINVLLKQVMLNLLEIPVVYVNLVQQTVLLVLLLVLVKLLPNVMIVIKDTS
jgi:hypothetical protein